MLKTTNKVLDQPIVVSSAKDELRFKQQRSETSEANKIERVHNPHQWI